MPRWKIAIEVWPHSTGNGNEADKKAAGADEGAHYFYVDASDIDEAMKMARCFAKGIACNPAVWQAPIIGVHVERPRAMHQIHPATDLGSARA